MNNSRSKLAYVPELDGLRGAAILAVMIFHSEVPFLRGTFIGVDIFFVISGFLITSLLVQEFVGTESVSLKNFYIRRVLRLGPALILLLVVFCFVSVVALSKEKAVRNVVDALIALFYLSNWARAFTKHPPDFLGHTWSLSMEEQFYILWPGILLMLLRVSKTRWGVIFAAISIALFAWCLRIYLGIGGSSVKRLYNGLDTRADALMIGCAVGILLSSGLLAENTRKLLSKWSVIIAPVAAISLLAFSFRANWRDLRMYYFGLIIIELLTAVLILDIFLNERSKVRKVLSIRWLVWIGSISYGLYLWHYPIYRTMFELGFGSTAVITVGSVVSLGVAACSYYFLEKPILKLKHRFTYRIPNKGIQTTPNPLRSAGVVDA